MNAPRHLAEQSLDERLNARYFEDVILGSLIRYGEEAALVLADTDLKAKDFGHEPIQDLHKLLLSRIEDGKPVDGATLSASLGRTDLNRFGGASRLEIELPARASLASLAYAAEQVRAIGQLRRLRTLTRWTQEKLALPVPEGNLPAYTRQLVNQVEELTGRLRDSTVKPTFRDAADFADEWLDRQDRVDAGEQVDLAIPTGLDELDRILNGGMYTADLVVLAGRPAMGKTSVGMSCAYNQAMAGHGVGFISIEQPGVQVLCKLASIHSQIDYSHFRSHKFDNADQKRRAIDAMHDMRGLGVKVNEAAFQWSDIRSQIRRLKLTMDRKSRSTPGHSPLRVVYIDYLGLMRNDEAENVARQEATDRIINGAKALAKELDIRIVVLVQINRDAVKGKETRPELHHLRSSGAIENAADVALLIHRDNYYYKEMKPGIATLIAAKNRHGETCDLDFNWNGATGTISNLDFRSPTASTYTGPRALPPVGDGGWE